MITVALSATIHAPHERVWRAIADPAERAAWDERILGEVSLSRGAFKAEASYRKLPGKRDLPDKKAPLRKTHWRFKLGGIPLVMQDEIVRADRHDRLLSRISIGSMHFDQTLTIHTEDDETGPRTRLGMKIVTRNKITVLGEVIPRLNVQKIVIEYVDSTLRQVQKHCETNA